jgi:hypothetical protein
MKSSYGVHLTRLFKWLDDQQHLQVLKVRYNQLMSTPKAEVARVAEFLDDRPRTDSMLEVIDPALYRNRNVTECLDGA